MSEEQKHNDAQEEARERRRSIAFFLKWTVLIAVGIPLVWFAFCEARKGYWDWRVTQMCERDGGIVVYEKTKIPSEYVDREGIIRIPVKPPSGRSPLSWEATQSDSFHAESAVRVLKRKWPRVTVTNVKIVRTHDGKILGEANFYQRSGGDAVSIDHPTHFSCPKGGVRNILIDAVFEGSNDASE